MKLLCLIAAASFLILPVLGQNKLSSVATVTDMLSQPPETFATSPTLGSPTFFAYVETSGDTVAGTWRKTWYWVPGSTLPTNSAANFGPLAYPYGAATGRWLYVPEAGVSASGVYLSSLGTAGQLPVFGGTNSIEVSGFTTNSIRNLGRVVPTVLDLLAESPTNLLSVPGGTAAWVQTVGDTNSAAPNLRTWGWRPSSAARTNTIGQGGPLAWPVGSSTGRWEQVPMAGALVPTDRVMTIPTDYADAIDGTVNATDPAPSIQAIWDAGSAAWNPYWGRVRILHPGVTFTGGELQFRSNLIYQALGEFHWKKRFDATNGTQRSTATTVRIGYANLDPVDKHFLSWGTYNGVTNYFADPDAWYGGQSANMTFCGPGKFIFDQNGKYLEQPNVRFLDFQNLEVLGGCVESWITQISTNGPGNSYGFGVGGRGLFWQCPIIRGGTAIWQDGFHAFSGSDWVISGGFSQSGDDSLAFEVQASGGSTLPPDEPLQRINVQGWVSASRRARAVIINGGVNEIDVPYTRGGLTCRDIHVSGITGTCAQDRQGAMNFGAYQDPASIWHYNIVNPGSGYTDGYYTNLPVSNTGGGSGAVCTVKVTGGQIVRAVPGLISGLPQRGANYKQDQTVTLASIPGGSGGQITGEVFGKPNNQVVNCSVGDFHLQMGGTNHDGTEPFEFKVHGVSNLRVGPGSISVIESGTAPISRPFYINAASNCLFDRVIFGPTTRGGTLNTTDYPKSFISGLVFEGCVIGPHNNGGQGLQKVNGFNVDDVTWRNSTFWIGNGMAAFYQPDFEGSSTNWIASLVLKDNSFLAMPTAATAKAMDVVPNAGGATNVFGYLELSGNTLRGITGFDSAAIAQASALAYLIDGNRGGFRSELWGTVTQTAGTTTVSVPVATFTGLPDATTASLPMVEVTPYGSVGAWWLTANSTTSVTINTAAAPGSNVTWGYRVRTHRKPLSAY